MKKTLVFLLLICLSLLTLTGCGKGNVSTKKLATEEEISEFFEEKELDGLFEDEISYNFKISYKAEKCQGANEETVKLSAKGRARVDFSNAEADSYLKGTFSRKGVEYSEEGKTKYSYKVTEELTTLDDKVYLYSKVKSTYGESKGTSEEKTKDGGEGIVNQYASEFLQEVLSNMGDDGRVYIDGDNCVMISSTTHAHTELVMIFDGDELETMYYTQKTFESELEVTIEFEDIEKISKPSNSSSYKKAE